MCKRDWILSRRNSDNSTTDNTSKKTDSILGMVHGIMTNCVTRKVITNAIAVPLRTVVQFGWILPLTGVSDDNEAFVANSHFSGCVDIDCGRK